MGRPDEALQGVGRGILKYLADTPERYRTTESALRAVLDRPA